MNQSFYEKFTEDRKREGMEEKKIGEEVQKLKNSSETFYDKKIEYVPGSHTFKGPVFANIYKSPKKEKTQREYKTILTNYENYVLAKDYIYNPMGVIAVIKTKDNQFIIGPRGIGNFEKEGESYKKIAKDEANELTVEHKGEYFLLKKDYLLQLPAGFCDITERGHEEEFIKTNNKLDVKGVTTSNALKESYEEVSEILENLKFEQIGFSTAKNDFGKKVIVSAICYAETDKTLEELNIKRGKDYMELPKMFGVKPSEINEVVKTSKFATDGKDRAFVGGHEQALLVASKFVENNLNLDRILDGFKKEKSLER